MEFLVIYLLCFLVFVLIVTPFFVIKSKIEWFGFGIIAVPVLGFILWDIARN